MTLPWTDKAGQVVAINALMAQTDTWVEEAKALEARLEFALAKINKGVKTVRIWINSPATGTAPFLIIDGGVSDSEDSEET